MDHSPYQLLSVTCCPGETGSTYHFFWGGGRRGELRQGLALLCGLALISLCRPSWPQIQDDPPASSSQWLGLQACSTMPSSIYSIINPIFTHKIIHKTEFQGTWEKHIKSSYFHNFFLHNKLSNILA